MTLFGFLFKKRQVPGQSHRRGDEPVIRADFFRLDTRALPPSTTANLGVFFFPPRSLLSASLMNVQSSWQWSGEWALMFTPRLLEYSGLL